MGEHLYFLVLLEFLGRMIKYWNYSEKVWNKVNIFSSFLLAHHILD